MSRLVRVGGPFDRPGAAASPATPTCCCCCCCLITTLTASTYAAVTVHREAEISGFEADRRRLVTTAAAFVVVLGFVPASLVAFVTPDSVFEDVPGGLILAAWIVSVVATWLVWMRLVLGWAGSPSFPAWWWSGKFAAVTGVAFAGEVITLGVLLYGQLLAIPAAVLVGVSRRRRLKEGST